jgi:hypothetical protein
MGTGILSHENESGGGAAPFPANCRRTLLSRVLSGGVGARRRHSSTWARRSPCPHQVLTGKPVLLATSLARACNR